MEFDPWSVYRGRPWLDIKELPILVGKTLVTSVTVHMERVPGQRINLGVIRPDLSEYNSLRDEIRAKAQAANMPDMQEYVATQLAMVAARGEIKWTTTFSTIRTTDQEFIYIFKPHGAYALNRDLLEFLRTFDCTTISITFVGRRDNVVWKSDLSDWVVRGIPYNNPAPPNDEQIVLTKNYMHSHDIGTTSPHIRDKRVELQQDREARRPWSLRDGF